MLIQLTRAKGVESNIYNPMNLSAVQQLTPSFNWTEYFNGIFDLHGLATDETYIIVYVPEYLRNLDQLFNKTDAR